MNNADTVYMGNSRYDKHRPVGMEVLGSRYVEGSVHVDGLAYCDRLLKGEGGIFTLVGLRSD